mgnify:CR=1 FL=1|jgi:hypothetical protein|tara:strand:- start:348 stop:581 length:234 start_codon:yes stop_codon:yes gene_type:complete
MSLTIGSTTNTDPRFIKKMFKQSPSADSVSVAVYDDEFYLLLFRNGRPIGKIPVEWALGAYDRFIEDVHREMSESSH